MTSLDDESTQKNFKSMSIGNRLRWLLERRDIKQLHLAEKLGIMQSTISNIVNDNSRSPSAHTLLLLVKELQCNPYWLINGEGNAFDVALTLHPDELRLITNYRSLPEDARKHLGALVQTLSAS